MRMKLKLAITAAVFAVSTVAVAPAPASASGQQITDPLYINWALKLPAYELPFDQGSADECVAGRDSCFVKTVQEMEKLLDGLTATCSRERPLSALAHCAAPRCRWLTSSPGRWPGPPWRTHRA